MTIETATFINGLNPLGPGAADPKSEGDDHIRLLKSTIKNTFPAITGAVTPTHTELNYVAGVGSGIQLQFNAVQGQFSAVQGQFVAQTAATATKGAIAGQTWTGTHDFTGGVLRAATPVGPSDVATMLYAQQYAQSLAFSSALPAIPGNAGKTITNDGSVSSWVERTLPDTTPVVYSSGNSTKRIRLDASGVTAGQTRKWATQDRDGTVAYLDDTGLALVMPPITPTAVNFIDIAFNSAYDNYQILLSGITPSTNGAQLYLRYFVAGVLDTAAKYASVEQGTLLVTTYSSGAFLLGNAGSIASVVTAGVSGTINILGINEAARPKNATAEVAFCNASGNLIGSYYATQYIGPTAVTGARLYWDTGVFNTSGKIRVYGWKNS